MKVDDCRNGADRKKCTVLYGVLQGKLLMKLKFWQLDDAIFSNRLLLNMAVFWQNFDSFFPCACLISLTGSSLRARRVVDAFKFVSNALEIKLIRISEWLVDQIRGFVKTFSISLILQKRKKALCQNWCCQTPRASNFFSGSPHFPVPGPPGQQMPMNEVVQTRLSSSLHTSHLATAYIVTHVALWHTHFPLCVCFFFYSRLRCRLLSAFVLPSTITTRLTALL